MTETSRCSVSSWLLNSTHINKLRDGTRNNSGEKNWKQQTGRQHILFLCAFDMVICFFVCLLLSVEEVPRRARSSSSPDLVRFLFLSGRLSRFSARWLSCYFCLFLRSLWNVCHHHIIFTHIVHPLDLPLLYTVGQGIGFDTHVRPPRMKTALKRKRRYRRSED